VQLYERAGVAAIHLEDQAAPKRCGHMEGKQVIPAAEMAQKIRAAVDARASADFVIIARTDAIAVEGFAAALDRARRYRDAGADVLFVEAPRTEGEIEAVAAAFPGVPLLFNWIEGGKTPLIPLSRIADLGFALVIFPVSLLFANAAAMRRVLESLRQGVTPDRAGVPLSTFGELTDLVGLPEVEALGRRYATAEEDERPVGGEGRDTLPG